MIVVIILVSVSLVISILTLRRLYNVSKNTGNKPGAIAERLSQQLTYQIDAQSKNQTLQYQGLQQAVNQIRETLYQELKEMQGSMQANLKEGRDLSDKRLQEIQSSNDKHLEEMRQTVEEKLEKTLQTRLTASFETVSKQLESVNRGLGEMQTLAKDVGNLNKTLSNTKTRGIMGEVLLGHIIEDILTPNQYEREFATIPNSNERVEFAIKMPGTHDGEYVYLPIDSKFPLSDY